jgi:hypothetical protein
MILLSLSALLLGTGLQVQPQAAAATVAMPVTEVIAMASPKPEVATSDVMKLVPDEVQAVVQLYLDGKVEQWYSRSDGKGVVLFLRCKSTDEAKAILAALPLVKAGYVEVDYIPVVPFAALGFLTRQPSADKTAPH